MMFHLSQHTMTGPSCLQLFWPRVTAQPRPAANIIAGEWIYKISTWMDILYTRHNIIKLKS